MGRKDEVISCEKKCQTCKKIFIMHEGWVFRRNSGSRELVFCSWGCLRKWEKNHGSRAERREKIIQAIKDGLNDGEIAELLGEDRSKVYYWRKKMEEENA